MSEPSKEARAWTEKAYAVWTGDGSLDLRDAFASEVEPLFRKLADMSDARNYVAEVALGISHYSGCGDPPCVRCERDARQRECDEYEAEAAKYQVLIARLTAENERLATTLETVTDKLAESCGVV